MLRQAQHDIAKNKLLVKTVSIRNVMLSLSKHLFKNIKKTPIF